VIWLNGKFRGTTRGLTTIAPWTWHHTGARMEIIPEGSMEIIPEGSMEIKHVEEETISYHALFTFDVIV
jgi:hypothetical protein